MLRPRRARATPTATVDRHLIIITEADIAQAVSGGAGAQQGVTLDNLKVRFAGGKTHITADKLGYGIIKMQNLDLVGSLAAQNGVLSLAVESISPAGSPPTSSRRGQSGAGELCLAMVRGGSAHAGWAGGVAGQVGARPIDSHYLLKLSRDQGSRLNCLNMPDHSHFSLRRHWQRTVTGKDSGRTAEVRERDLP